MYSGKGINKQKNYGGARVPPPTSAIHRTNTRIPVCSISTDNIKENDSTAQIVLPLPITDNSRFSEGLLYCEKGALASASHTMNKIITVIMMKAFRMLSCVAFLRGRTCTTASSPQITAINKSNNLGIQ
jgi:hypothetical protein